MNANARDGGPLDAIGQRASLDDEHHSASRQQLRLSGNKDIGGQAILGILGSLATCSTLRAVHVEGCGLTKSQMAPLVETMHEVWCVHELIIDRTIPEGKVGAAARLVLNGRMRSVHFATAPPASEARSSGKVRTLPPHISKYPLEGAPEPIGTTPVAG